MKDECAIDSSFILPPSSFLCDLRVSVVNRLPNGRGRVSQSIVCLWRNDTICSLHMPETTGDVLRSNASRTPRLLVVDDDKAIRSLLTAVPGRKGYSVQTARDR